LYPEDNITSGEGRGAAFIMLLEGGKDKVIVRRRRTNNSGRDPRISEEAIPKGQARECESLWKKMIGKPYSGKLNVRFDEGELEIGHG